MRPLVDGIRRVNAAPSIVAGVWLLTFLVALPLAMAMRGLVAQHLGASLAADSAAAGVNYDWMQEFSEQATGVAATLKPAVIGFAAVLDNASGFVDNAAQPAVIVGAAAAYMILWIFLAGGILDRFARARPTRAHGFFAASGVFFWRFVRLAVVQWLVYAFLFGSVHPWLFGRLFPEMTRETSVERTAFLVRLVLYVVFGVLLIACNLIFDYAKVRAVVEDRRSALGAISAAIRFIGRNYGAAVSLYLVDAALFVVVLALYALVAPGAGSAGLSMWFAFVIGQLYILARLWVKLVFWASEISLFQSRLAHAGYVARPVPTWPESPAAEAI